MNIYEKLQQARVELQARGLKKSGHNDYSGFDYFDLSDFLPAVNEIFAGLKLHSRFSIMPDKSAANLTIINAEAPDETEEYLTPTAEVTLKGCTPIQSLGGTHTYLKRYLYLNALEICEGDIVDKMSGASETADTVKRPTPATMKSCAELGIDPANVAAYLKKPVSDLTDNDLQYAVTAKRKAAARKAAAENGGTGNAGND